MTMFIVNKLKFFLFFLIISSSSLFSYEVPTESCNSSNIDQFLEAEYVKYLDIEIHKYKKWTKNLLKAVTNKDAKDISQKYKKRFKATVTAVFNNNLTCSFKSKIRINGDHRDHLDFAPSLDVELVNGNINSITSFKLFLPQTRSNDNEIFITSLLKELGFLSPVTYYVSASLNEVDVKYIFQEKVIKEFIESNELREGPILEGDERFIFNAGLPFGLARQSNEKWITGGFMSLGISKLAINNLNKVYLESLLGEQYFYNLNQRFFRSESLSDNKDFIQEAQEFSSILLALGASHGLRPHNRKFYYDPMYNSYRPIYYDGEANILENLDSTLDSFLDSEDKVNFDEIVGSKFAISLLDSMNRVSFKNKLLEAGLTYNIERIDAVLDHLKNRLTLISNLLKTDYMNEYKQYFSIKKGLENKGLKKGLRLVFSSKGPLDIEVCNFELTICSNDKFTIQDYAKLLSGKYITPDGRQYIYIGNKEEYEAGQDLEEELLINQSTYLIDNTKLITFGDVKMDLDKKNKEIYFYQENANSRVLFVGGNLENWTIEFLGSDKNLINSDQRFNKNLLTGCMTFLDLTINKSNLKINNSFCEDGVNFIRVKGSLDNISVENSISDAIDADFSRLNFLNIFVDNAVNDCVDFSYGKYNIVNAELTRCLDKGISGGEKTQLNLNQVTISESNIGIAAKDSSVIIVKEMISKDVNTCFSAYNKKQEFWGGKIIYEEHNCKTDQMYTQQGSLITSLN